MTEPGRPDPPDGLEKPGRSLWRKIQRGLDSDWQLDARELFLLEKACEIADRVALINASVQETGTLATGSRGQVVIHPVVAEVRQLQLVQLRMLDSLELVDPAVQRQREPLRSQRARTAARARWGKEDGRLRSVRDG